MTERVGRYLADWVEKKRPICVVVAHRAGARIFEYGVRADGLRQTEEISFPEARLKTHDIESDRPGRTWSAVTSGKHGYAPRSGAKNQRAMHLAKQIAQILDRGRNSGRYGSLVLVAESGFMGILKRALNRQTAERISATVEKELLDVRAEQIARNLASVLEAVAASRSLAGGGLRSSPLG